MNDGFKTRIPYGYRMENGRMVVLEEEAQRLKTFFDAYLSGITMLDAGKMAGLTCSTSSYPNLIERRIYAGDMNYPAIITSEYQEKLFSERERRGSKKPRKAVVCQKLRICTEFSFPEDKPVQPWPKTGMQMGDGKQKTRDRSSQTQEITETAFPDFQHAQDAAAYCAQLYAMIQSNEIPDAEPDM